MGADTEVPDDGGFTPLLNSGEPFYLAQKNTGHYLVNALLYNSHYLVLYAQRRKHRPRSYVLYASSHHHPCFLGAIHPPIATAAWRGDAPLLKQLLAVGARLDVRGVSRGQGPYGPLEWAELKVS